MSNVRTKVQKNNFLCPYGLMPYLGNELPGYLKRCPVALQPIYSAWVLMSGRHLFYNSRGHLCLRYQCSKSFAVWKTGT